MKTTVKITKNKKSSVYTLDMAKLLLELVGGGINTQQTAKAIDMNREFAGSGKVTFNGFLIEKV